MTDTPSAGGVEARIVLALGSNLGDRLEHLREAARGASRFMRVVEVSPVYESAPTGYEDQPDFLNAVMVGTTTLEPRELLAAAHRLEADAGRRRTFPDAPRVLDVDLILYGGLVLRHPELSLPHPRWKERAFVLGPLADAGPELVDPETGRTVQDLWNSRRDRLPPLHRVAPPEALWRNTT